MDVRNKIILETRIRGFSFIELLIVLLLLSIGISSGVPAMLNLSTEHTMSVTMRTLMGSLIQARSEAIKSGGRVTVAGRNGDWSQGWVVFEDSNLDATPNLGETTVSQTNRLGNRYRLNGNRPVAEYVSYVASGQSERLTGAIQMGTLTLCDTKSNKVKQLVISSSGRPKMVSPKTTDSTCQ